MSYITNEDGSLTYQFAKSERPTLPPSEGPLTASGTDAYLVSKIAHPGYAADPVIARAQKRADEAGLPDIQVTLMQGQFLAVLARSIRAERILEIGTLAGISTIFLARTLPPHGQIDTLEFSPKHAKIAQENFLDADLYPFPKVHIGAAMDTLTDPAGPFARPPGTDEGLKESERGYDLIFIDADKDNILGYWLEALRLVRKGGVIIVDNAVRGGRISLEVNDQPDIDVKGLRQIYDWVEADQGKTVIMSCLQTVGAKVWDGFAMATKL